MSLDQLDLFGGAFKEDVDQKYTTKVEAPLYLPSERKPHLLELTNFNKYKKLKKEIENSNLSSDEKDFLIMASTRHIVFNYSKIADYYSHASKDMQNLMENSALVIIDFNKSIECGFTKLNDELKELYLSEK